MSVEISGGFSCVVAGEGPVVVVIVGGVVVVVVVVVGLVVGLGLVVLEGL